MINIRPASEFGFINNRDSFQIIYQYFLNKTFICRRISFDENGNYLHSWLLDSVSTNSSVQTDSYFYQFIASSDKNKFMLFKSSIDTELNVLNINYRFFNKHTETANTQTLPFYFKLSAISNIVLDNDNLTLAISTYKDSAYQLSVYKINLISDTSINSIRQILNGRLIDQSINISENYNRLLVSAMDVKRTT